MTPISRRTTLAALLGAMTLPVVPARASGFDELSLDWATYNPVSIVIKEQGLIEKEFAADNIPVLRAKVRGRGLARLSASP